MGLIHDRKRATWLHTSKQETLRMNALTALQSISKQFQRQDCPLNKEEKSQCNV